MWLVMLPWRAVLWSILAWQFFRQNETCQPSLGASWCFCQVFARRCRHVGYWQTLSMVEKFLRWQWLFIYIIIRHFQIMERVGHLLGMVTDNHDLFQSRIAQKALGFLWHWPGETNQSSHMKKLALDAVYAGHLGEEHHHHPEYQKAGTGWIDFIDTLWTDSQFICKMINEMDTKGGISTSISYQLSIRMNGNVLLGGIDLHDRYVWSLGRHMWKIHSELKIDRWWHMADFRIFGFHYVTIAP